MVSQMSSIYSSEEELLSISRILAAYLSLPIATDSIPGALLENVMAFVRGGKVLNTYDFVDVMRDKDHVGWQVKSTKSRTPVTWKRAKLEGSDQLIRDSWKSKKNLQHLGDSIIRFCNDHARESLDKYQIESIGFSRLIVFPDGKIRYYERELCSNENPDIFNAGDYFWQWPQPKKSAKKVQLPALQGINRKTNEKWFAWHGLGENQLHFVGEKNWWPTSHEHTIDFAFPDERLSQDQFMKLLESIKPTRE